MNLYEWEAKAASTFKSKGDAWLTWALLAAGVAIILIALFSRNVLFKSLVAAYVLLP
jgi:hypothetical protein